jgi:hypothetical protein
VLIWPTQLRLPDGDAAIGVGGGAAAPNSLVALARDFPA